MTEARASARAVEAVIADIRREFLARLDRMDGQIAAAVALATASEGRIMQHIAVCAVDRAADQERRKEWRELEDKRAASAERFASESSADRASLRLLLQQTSAKLMIAIIAMGILAAGLKPLLSLIPAFR